MSAAKLYRRGVHAELTQLYSWKLSHRHSVILLSDLLGYMIIFQALVHKREIPVKTIRIRKVIYPIETLRDLVEVVVKHNPRIKGEIAQQARA